MHEFNARKIITFDEFSDFIEMEKKEFIISKEKILKNHGVLQKEQWNNNLDAYQNFRKEYREIVIKSFEKVIDFYSKYLPKKHLILLEGSYGRDSDRIFSDIDYTLVYDVPKTIYLQTIEELINVSISKIFDISRDKVHSIFTYIQKDNSIHEYMYNDYDFVMHFEGFDLKYRCRENTVRDVVANLYSVRDYKSLLRYIEAEMKVNPCTEWLYSFKVVRNTGDYNFKRDIEQLMKKHRVISYTKLAPTVGLLGKNFTVAVLKKTIKYDFFDQFYSFISTIYQVLFYQGLPFEFLNLTKFFDASRGFNIITENELSNIKRIYIEYLFLINRFEITLRRKKLELSSHCFISVKKDELEMAFQEDWLTANVLDIMHSKKCELFKWCNSILEKIYTKESVNIFTFPCSPRKSLSIQKCLPYLLSDYIKKILRYSSSTGTFNVLGSKHSNDYLQEYKEYLVDTLRLSFDSFVSDAETIVFSLKKIRQLYEMGIVVRDERKMVICPCGAVELYVNEEDKTYLSPDLYFVKKTSEKTICICKKCGQECQEIKKEALFIELKYNLDEIKNINVYPEFSKKQMLEISQKMQGKSIMISRNRKTGVVLDLNEQHYNIDVDFVWLFMFLASNSNRIIAITGYREIFYVYLSSVINNLIFNKEIYYMTFPYLSEMESFQYDLSVEQEKLLYILSSKINKENVKITNASKVAISKKKTYAKIKETLFKPLNYLITSTDSYIKMCEEIKKRQHQL